MKAVLIILGAIALAFVGSAVFFPVFAGDGIRAADSVCLSNVKQTSLGLVMYANDENGRWPLRDAWMDAAVPYTKGPDLLHCPSSPKGSYGYAFNGALSAAKMPKEGDGAATALLYESVNPIRNASDLVTSLPAPGRHKGRNMVGYADGHAKAVAGGIAP